MLIHSSYFEIHFHCIKTMAKIPGFWDVGPHDSLPVEATWTEFVASIGGERVVDHLSKSPDFDNADYLFSDMGAVLELKEIETEYLQSEAAQKGLNRLVARLVEEYPTWRPQFFGGGGQYPAWFQTEFIRLARPALLRVLKKANRQIRETKHFFEITNPHGILIFVNDGFTGMAPDLVHALACDALVYSYSSIDCFLYITVNRYVEVIGSNEPKLIWNPSYSIRATDQLVQFIDDLGRKWVCFIEQKIGPFTSRTETGDRSMLSMSRTIILPGENRS